MHHCVKDNKSVYYLCMGLPNLSPILAICSFPPFPPFPVREWGRAEVLYYGELDVRWGAYVVKGSKDSIDGVAFIVV